jgi:hypothetical protein
MAFGGLDTLLMTARGRSVMLNAMCNLAEEVVVVSIPAPEGVTITQ